MIILFILIFVICYCVLNEMELRKYKKITDKKLKKLNKKIKTLEQNSNVCFSYINDIYDMMVGVDSYENEKKCQ